MKKKLLAILAAFVAVTPLAGVKADIDYTVGTEQNFIVNETQEKQHNDESLTQEQRESVGIKVISLGEDPDDSGYVKALATGANTYVGKAIFDPNKDAPTSFEGSLAYEDLLNDFNGATADDMRLVDKMKDKNFDYNTQLTTPYVKNYNSDHKYLTLPTKDEILTWFANEKVNDNKYTLTADGLAKFKKWYSYSLTMMAIDYVTGNTLAYGGYLTSSYEVTTDDILIWVIVPTINAEGEVTAITVQTISNNALFAAQNDRNSTLPLYVMVPVLSFNKTYNCRFEVVKQTACYKCDDKYQWLVVGEQESTCTIVSGVTSKAKCTDNPKTGVEDYILEFAIAAGICGIVLLAVKRKSLFSRV